MRALRIAIVCLLVACRKQAPSQDEEQRKPRVDVTVLLDPSAPIPPDAISIVTAAPPSSRQMFERSGVHVAVVGIAVEGDPTPLMWKEVSEAESAGSNATVVVTRRCLKDLAPVLQKNLLYFWTVALVVGARCDGNSSSTLGAAALVEVGSASRVRITFDRRTRAFLRVEPSR